MQRGTIPLNVHQDTRRLKKCKHIARFCCIVGRQFQEQNIVVVHFTLVHQKTGGLLVVRLCTLRGFGKAPLNIQTVSRSDTDSQDQPFRTQITHKRLQKELNLCSTSYLLQKYTLKNKGSLFGISSSIKNRQRRWNL